MTEQLTTDNEITVFAPSMATLIMALKRFPVQYITIITYSDSVIEFSKKTDLKLIELNQFSDLSREGIKRYKEYINAKTEELKNKQIFFSFRNNLKWEGYFLKRLSNSNTLMFDNVDPILPQTRFCLIRFLQEKSYRRTLFAWFIYFIYFKQNYSVFRQGKDQYVLGITPEQCNSFSTKLDPIENSSIIFKKNQEEICQKIKLPSFDILFVDNVSKNVEASLMKKITLVLQRFNKSIILKPHYSDSFKPSIILTDAFITIPKEIPVELMDGMPKLVIGFYSTALLHFSKNVPVISLAHFETPDMHETKAYFVNRMKLEPNIFMPDTIEKLEELLKLIQF